MKVYKRSMMVLLSAVLLSGNIGSLNVFGKNIEETVPKMAKVKVKETVSVGLETKNKNTVQVPLSNTSIELGYIKDGEFKKDISFESVTGFKVAVSTYSYIVVDKNFESFEDAFDLSEKYVDLGLDAVPALLNDKMYTVYIKNSTISNVDKVVSYDTKVVPSNSGSFVLLAGDKNLLVVEEGNNLSFVSSDSKNIKLYDRTYRGAMQFSTKIKGAIMPVNVLSMEEYLYGVLPGEMPALYETEALKAQAVAARSYTYTRIGIHKESGYELCDTVHCQVYGGAGAEHERATNAVKETKDEIAVFNGAPINAVFFASSGGYTENSEDVWTNVIPYLRGVKEIGEYDTNTWTKTITIAQLDTLMSIKGENIGYVKDILITEISEGGRIQELKILGTSGEKTLRGESVRTYFSPISGSFPSKLFTINGNGNMEPVLMNNAPIVDEIKNKEIKDMEEQNREIKKITVDTVEDRRKVSISTVDGNGNFVFNGLGNGHGAGMSQKGAQGMAKKGYEYEEILNHYYTGITLQK